MSGDFKLGIIIGLLILALMVLFLTSESRTDVTETAEVSVEASEEPSPLAMAGVGEFARQHYPAVIVGFLVLLTAVLGYRFRQRVVTATRQEKTFVAMTGLIVVMLMGLWLTVHYGWLETAVEEVAEELVVEVIHEPVTEKVVMVDLPRPQPDGIASSSSLLEPISRLLPVPPSALAVATITTGPVEAEESEPEEPLTEAQKMAIGEMIKKAVADALKEAKVADMKEWIDEDDRDIRALARRVYRLDEAEKTLAERLRQPIEGIPADATVGTVGSTPEGGEAYSVAEALAEKFNSLGRSIEATETRLGSQLSDTERRLAAALASQGMAQVAEAKRLSKVFSMRGALVNWGNTLEISDGEAKGTATLQKAAVTVTGNTTERTIDLDGRRHMTDILLEPGTYRCVIRKTVIVLWNKSTTPTTETLPDQAWELVVPSVPQTQHVKLTKEWMDDIHTDEEVMTSDWIVHVSLRKEELAKIRLTVPVVPVPPPAPQ